MKTVITKKGKRKHYYEKGDKVVCLTEGKSYRIDSVIPEKKVFISTNGDMVALGKNIRPIQSVIDNATVVDKRLPKEDEFNVRVEYYNQSMPRFKKIEKGDWVDVRVNKVCACDNVQGDINYAMKNRIVQIWDGNGKISYKAGDVVIMRLGFAMQLPKGCEAELRPRSGTFKNYGLLLTNSVGTIDESYCGSKDEWCMMFYATRDGQVEAFDRVGQFRITEKMKKVNFHEADLSKNADRGGYSSTGVK